MHHLPQCKSQLWLGLAAGAIQRSNLPEVTLQVVSHHAFDTGNQALEPAVATFGVLKNVPGLLHLILNAQAVLGHSSHQEVCGRARTVSSHQHQEQVFPALHAGFRTTAPSHCVIPYLFITSSSAPPHGARTPSQSGHQVALGVNLSLINDQIAQLHDIALAQSLTIEFLRPIRFKQFLEIFKPRQGATNR